MDGKGQNDRRAAISIEEVRATFADEASNTAFPPNSVRAAGRAAHAGLGWNDLRLEFARAPASLLEKGRQTPPHPSGSVYPKCVYERGTSR